MRAKLPKSCLMLFIAFGLSAAGAQGGPGAPLRRIPPQIDFGARYGWFDHKPLVPFDAALVIRLLRPVSSLEGDPSKISTTGYGVQVGLGQTVKFFDARLIFFYTRYLPVHHTFDVGGYSSPVLQTISPTSLGFQIAIGVKVWWFTPSFLFSIQNNRNTVVLSSSDPAFPASTTFVNELQLLYGVGVGLTIPIFGGFRIVAHGEYRLPAFYLLSSTYEFVARAGISLGGSFARP